MSKVTELFGIASTTVRVDWRAVVGAQQCPFSGKKCFKTRKSDKTVSIGTCSVSYGEGEPVIICPNRMLERRQVFVDCLPLLTLHEPGNELHVVSEVKIPGGNVDFFLVSARDGRVRDFVGIEFQTLDTSGTVWPERQRLLRELNVPRSDNGELSSDSFGMNWKMTSKTILVQMHHKAQTFEHINKKLVLVVQDRLLDYMRREFNFSHVRARPSVSDSVHIHAYGLKLSKDFDLRLELGDRNSTDAEGIGQCLGMQAEARVEYDQIVARLEKKMSRLTLVDLISGGLL